MQYYEITRDTKLVKVRPERGWDAGIYEIVRYSPRECSIRRLDGRIEDTIYTAHLFRDAECIRREIEWRAARAQKIGRKK